jgi:hypothetical protein
MLCCYDEYFSRLECGFILTQSYTENIVDSVVNYFTVLQSLKYPIELVG